MRRAARVGRTINGRRRSCWHQSQRCLRDVWKHTEAPGRGRRHGRCAASIVSMARRDALLTLTRCRRHVLSVFELSRLVKPYVQAWINSLSRTVSSWVDNVGDSLRQARALHIDTSGFSGGTAGLSGQCFRVVRCGSILSGSSLRSRLSSCHLSTDTCIARQSSMSSHR